MQKSELNWSLTGNSKHSIKMGRGGLKKNKMSNLSLQPARVTLAYFYCGQGGSTNADRRRGIKGSSHDKLSGNVSLSCF